ncbi:L-selectin CD62 antigen-like family member L [Collichthys lucidus]|uniref:L-selectin CD62 antigen-like family member L n=1 Tax=Collichthys lucidus TaxID=240159 RepID=A0A4U5VCD8_COLLU|nr:L-selectin CD62 antigen-like family member L [Collichthys lucidus]
MYKVLLLILAAAGLSAVSSHVKRKYHFVYEPKNMSEARTYCREHYTDLASMDDMEDVENMKKLADTSKLNSAVDLLKKLAWIGLYDDMDSWKWSLADSSFYKHRKTDFRRWLVGEPNNVGSKEHCVWMDGDGRWADHKCADRFQSICMNARVTKKEVIRLKLKTNSSVDLNDPTVADKILAQLKQKLKDQGVDVDLVKLSWKKQLDGKVFFKQDQKQRKKRKKLEL